MFGRTILKEAWLQAGSGVPSAASPLPSLSLSASEQLPTRRRTAQKQALAASAAAKLTGCFKKKPQEGLAVLGVCQNNHDADSSPPEV